MSPVHMISKIEARESGKISTAERLLLRKTSRPAATYREYRLVIVNRLVATRERIAHCCTILKRARQIMLLASPN